MDYHTIIPEPEMLPKEKRSTRDKWFSWEGEIGWILWVDHVQVGDGSRRYQMGEEGKERRVWREMTKMGEHLG